MAITGKDISDLARKQPLRVGCAALLAIFGLYLYFTAGAGDTLQARLSEIESKRSRIDGDLRNAALLVEDRKTVTAAVERLRTFAMRPDDVAANTNYFLRLEESSGARLPNPATIAALPPGKTTFAPVNVSLAATGEYAQLLRLIRLVEEGPRLSRVRSASLSPVKNGMGPYALTLNLEVLALR